MDFIRTLDSAKAQPTGCRGDHVQVLSHLETGIFIAGTIEAGGTGQGSTTT